MYRGDYLELKIYSDEEMQVFGAALAEVLDKDDVVYLYGTLGAGKTTLVRGFVRAMGYKGRISSPTFTIMNIYDADPPVYHFDFYRLGNADMDDLGLEDYLEREGISFIEWPQAGRESLPEEALTIEIDLTDNDYERERQLKITAEGSKYREKLERLMQVVHFGDR